MTIPPWRNSCIATLKASSGSCIITIKEWHPGVGSLIIITHRGYPVCFFQVFFLLFNREGLIGDNGRYEER